MLYCRCCGSVIRNDKKKTTSDRGIDNCKKKNGILIRGMTIKFYRFIRMKLFRY